MNKTTDPRFSVRDNGSIGLEIVSPRGQVVAWTVDPVVAQVISSHLNEIGEFAEALREGDK